MKKIKYLFIAMAAFIVFQSCKKKEAVLGSFESLGVGSYLTLQKSNKVILDYSKIASESVSITVKEYGSAVDKIVVYVTAGGVSLNKSNWKKVKEFTYTSGSELELKVTAAEIATALGVPTSSLNPGNSYTLYNQVVTKEGLVYDAVNTVGALASNPNYKASTTWSANVVCPFVATGFPGNFVVRQDDWEDWGPGDVVTVQSATANSIALRAYPNPAYGTRSGDITVNIDATNGIATVANQTYGAYGATVVATTTVGSSNFVFACTGTIDLRLNHHVPGSTASSYGTYWIRLTKQ